MSINRRIDKIADQYASRPLRVLVEMPDGTRRVMSVSEMVSQRLKMICVTSGNSLRDLDRIIEYGYSEAYR